MYTLFEFLPGKDQGDADFQDKRRFFKNHQELRFVSALIPPLSAFIRVPFENREGHP
jgi:hypothetical protein